MASKKAQQQAEKTKKEKQTAVAIVVVSILISGGVFLRGPFQQQRTLKAQAEAAKAIQVVPPPKLNADAGTSGAAVTALGTSLSKSSVRAHLLQLLGANGIAAGATVVVSGGAPSGTQVQGAGYQATVTVSGSAQQTAAFVSDLTGSVRFNTAGQLRATGQLYALTSLTSIENESGNYKTTLLISVPVGVKR